MNPVHAVLRNCDILQVILNFMKADFGRGRKDLVAVALVCRALSDLALDILWRNADLDYINFLFPMDIIRAHTRRTKLLTRAPTTPQEWERFDVYASRIRTLSCASPSPNEIFLHGARMRYPTSHPFPHLTCLDWSSTPSESVEMMILICPTLTEVEFSIDALGDDEDEKDAVADVLWSLGEKCSQLRRFEYHLTTLNNCSRSVETALIYLIRQCSRLEYVFLPVSRDLLRALGSLPHLSMLRLDYVEWEDGSQLYLPTQADDWSEAVDRFPVLNDLTIQYSHTVSSLTECFQGSGCFPRESFTMWEMAECEQWSTLAIAEFFRGILRPDRIEGLLVFWIDRDIEVRNPVGHDPWQALRCLPSIPNLRTLSLIDLFLDINDTDLEEIPRIWPRLQSLLLALDVPRIDDSQSQISFQGLAHLSTLKHLEDVSLMLAPDSTISESMLSPSTSSNSPLKYLTIQGKFPPVPPYTAIMFLILHFPRLKKIDTSLYFDKGEAERIQEMQVLLDAARPIMKDLRSECRSLRSGPGVEQEGGED